MQSYKLFVNLGFFDCLQLCFHWTAGVLVLFPQICEEDPYICWVGSSLSMRVHFAQFLGASLNSAWVGLFPATVVIAAQRLYIIVHRINSQSFQLHSALKVGQNTASNRFPSGVNCCWLDLCLHILRRAAILWHGHVLPGRVRRSVEIAEIPIFQLQLGLR